ncbi:MAG: hypothetical protein ACXV3S_00795 [Kineosporiaceae bacterium]
MNTSTGEVRSDTARRRAPATVVNGPRVTVAFPFSHISLAEPSTEIRVLAELVADLADALAVTPATDEVEALRQRAHDVRDALGGGMTSEPDDPSAPSG